MFGVINTTNWRYFFCFFLENKIWHFMQIIFLGDNLHEVSNHFF